MLTIFKVRITSNKIRIYTVLITKKASFILKIMRWYVIYVGGNCLFRCSKMRDSSSSKSRRNLVSSRNNNWFKNSKI